MDAKYTKGPWEVDGPKDPVAIDYSGSLFVFGPDCEQVAEVFKYQDPYKRELGIVAANARLIASAPELLEASKAALDILEAENRTEYDQGGISMLRTAIKKAIG